MDDDIPIPAPRTRADARVWYCSNCGTPGTPDESSFAHIADPRYATGQHDCLRPYRGRRPPVQYVADWAFDRERWRRQQHIVAMQKLQAKSLRGTALTAAERRQLEAYLKEQRGDR